MPRLSTVRALPTSARAPSIGGADDYIRAENAKREAKERFAQEDAISRERIEREAAERHQREERDMWLAMTEQQRADIRRKLPTLGRYFDSLI